jgi:hypothetical protein
MALLFIPVYFIGASALRQDAPGLNLLGSPIILLGAVKPLPDASSFVTEHSALMGYQLPV